MTGYYQTPNKDIPLNDREPGEIADVAKERLRKWEAFVANWPIDLVFRNNRWCNICATCWQNIWFERDKNGVNYTYSDAEILALIVAHVMQVHSEALDGNK
jgi:hypothetical protein